jgi:hypothetical protein
MADMDIAPTGLAVYQLCKLVASGRITAQQFTDMTLRSNTVPRCAYTDGVQYAPKYWTRGRQAGASVQ